LLSTTQKLSNVLLGKFATLVDIDQRLNFDEILMEIRWHNKLNA
jgi:hypothetical protein